MTWWQWALSTICVTIAAPMLVLFWWGAWLTRYKGKV